MRVSTSQMFQQSVDSMMASSSAVSLAQQNITNGSNINSASQNVTAVKLSSQLLLVQKQATVFSANIDELDLRFAEADTSLDSVGNALQHLNELMTQSRNGALNADGLASLAFQAKLDATAIGAEMNRTDSQGRKIYSYTSEAVDTGLSDARARLAAASSAKAAAEQELVTARAALVPAKQAFTAANSVWGPLEATALAAEAAYATAGQNWTDQQGLATQALKTWTDASAALANNPNDKTLQDAVSAALVNRNTTDTNSQAALLEKQSAEPLAATARAEADAVKQPKMDAQAALDVANAEVIRLAGDLSLSTPGGLIAVEAAKIAAANADVATWVQRKTSLDDDHPKLEVRPGQVMNTEVLFSSKNRSDMTSLDPDALANAIIGAGEKSSLLKMSVEATQKAIDALPIDPSDPATKDKLQKLQAQLVNATKFESAQTVLKTATDPLVIAAANTTIASRQLAMGVAQDQDRADAEITISNLLDATLQARGKVGANWAVLTDYQDTNQSFVLAAQQSLSNMRDTDIAKSVSDLANYQAQLQAARAIFNRIQSATSLFDLIR